VSHAIHVLTVTCVLLKYEWKITNLFMKYFLWRILLKFLYRKVVFAFVELCMRHNNILLEYPVHDLLEGPVNTLWLIKKP